MDPRLHFIHTGIVITYVTPQVVITQAIELKKTLTF